MTSTQTLLELRLAWAEARVRPQLDHRYAFPALPVWRYQLRASTRL